MIAIAAVEWGCNSRKLLIGYDYRKLQVGINPENYFYIGA
jgi:hypothetical protein